MSPSITILFITPVPTSARVVSNDRFVHSLGQRTQPICTNHRRRSVLKPLSTITSTASADGDSSETKNADSPNRDTLNEGDIVAIWRGSGNKCDVARVTGGVSSGQTVDIIPLKPFVKELYVDANSGPSYESASNVRLVRSEYVPSQDGWIVLDNDLQSATEYFALRPADLGHAEVSVKQNDESRQLSPDAIQRQFFRPTRSQAYIAAALSLPIAGILYAAYGRARAAYQAAPAGEDLLHGLQFRALVQYFAAGGAILTLVVGSGLFLYALNAPASSADE